MAAKAAPPSEGSDGYADGAQPEGRVILEEQAGQVAAPYLREEAGGTGGAAHESYLQTLSTAYGNFS